MSVCRKKVLIAGASGVVGQAAVRHFGHSLEWDVIGVSRRPPLSNESRVTHISVDLLDRQRCSDVFGQMSDVTHLVYAAVNENPEDLRGGWRDTEQMRTNLQMLENLLEPLLGAAEGFQHLSLLQGTKAYGVHAGMHPNIPLREDSPRQIHDNFYFLQEDYIRARQVGQPWHWTILRPVLIFGDAVGSNLNSLLAIAVYGALRKEAGLPLPNLKGGHQITECVDSDLLARALMWAATSLASRNEVFNVANGDHVTMHDLWPIVSEELGMEIGSSESISLTRELRDYADTWSAMVRTYDLAAPDDLMALLGGSITLAEGTLAESVRAPALVSTIKIRQAGFHDCMNTEESVRKWFRRFQELRLIPPVADRGAGAQPGLVVAADNGR